MATLRTKQEVQPLKVAPWIRVSSESQEKHGESITVQSKQITQTVERLGGEIVAWYGGQEHATPGWERIQLDRLLEDATAGKFDAIMVADHSRWSRDNRRSKEDLEVLRQAGVQFFVLGTRVDLNNAHDCFMLGVTTEVNEFTARLQAEKSINSRIERARQGRPSSSGKLPYGRTWSEEAGWDTDPNAKQKINAAAQEYLSTNIGFEELGRKYGMNGSNLHKVLTKTGGSVWIQHFRLKSAGIDDRVETKVPPLLSDEVMEEVRQKAAARRTWARGQQKNHYLFSRKIRDARTGYALTGCANSREIRYYRPYRDRKGCSWSVNADQLEAAVTSAMGAVLTRQHDFFRAVLDGHGVPDGKIEDLLNQKSVMQREHKRVQRRYDNLINEIEDGEISKVRTRKRAHDLESRLDTIEANIAEINDKLEEIPKLTQADTARKALAARLLNAEKKGPRKPTAADVRASAIRSQITSGLGFDQDTINLIFGGTDPWGRKYGIYITPHLDGPRRWYEWEAYGRLGTLAGDVWANDLEPGPATYQSPTHEDTATLKTVQEKLAEEHTDNPKTIFAKR